MRSPFSHGKTNYETPKGTKQSLQISSRKVTKDETDLNANIIVSYLGDWFNGHTCQYVYSERMLPFKIALMAGIHLCLLKAQTFEVNKGTDWKKSHNLFFKSAC